MSMLKTLVPCPVKTNVLTGRLPLKSIVAVSSPMGWERFADELIALFRDFGITLRKDIDGVSPAGVMRVQRDHSLSAEAWNLMITPGSIQIKGGDNAGMFYAIAAMRQLAFLASATGVADAAFDCGEIEDAPRFPWRGFMLDSARHFQPKETIIETLHRMACYRLNVFHWHVTENQGWRLPCAAAPRLPGGEPVAGHYSLEDIRDINLYAKKHFIRIVPEIDIPGHSGRLVRSCPHLACDPSRPRYELCLGKPEVKAFLKQILAETADLFPDSPILHLGGDEASTADWDQCPDCQRALKAAGLSDIRKLENQFMIDMSRFVVDELGRRVMVWHTESIMPPDTIIQAWVTERDIGTTLPRGNPIVNSACYRFYFDNPYNINDPYPDGEAILSEENVYMAEPCSIWQKEARDQVLGAEACLWTGSVPSWRVAPKIRSRLAAFSETAWSLPEHKQWQDFQRRQACLQAAGYTDAVFGSAHAPCCPSTKNC